MIVLKNMTGVDEVPVLFKWTKITNKNKFIISSPFIADITQFQPLKMVRRKIWKSWKDSNTLKIDLQREFSCNIMIMFCI